MDRLGLPEITAKSEEGFSDLYLRLEDPRHDSDGIYRMIASGRHRGTRVSFAIRLSATWERQDLEGSKIALYWGRVELRSVGEESDFFLRALDEVYQTNVNPQAMQETVSFLAVSLEGHPFEVEQNCIKLKLFYESEEEERDADFFLNIDPVASRVEFREKDKDYRRGVVLSLRAQ